MKKALIVLSLLTMIFLSSCTRKVGWVGTNIGNEFTARFQFFDGQQTDTIRLDAGERFNLKYEIEVVEGSLTLELLDPEKALLWEKRFLEKESSNFEFTSETSGQYTLKVIGREAQGSFDLRWEITD